MTQRLMIALSFLMLFTGTGLAHHSFSATYDTSKTVNIEGKVVQFLLRNPHSFLHVAVLKDGILQQCDSPRHMYDHPNNVFVAGFIGSPAMNLLEVPVADGGVDVGGHTVPVERATLTNAGKNVTLGVRPEDLEVATEGGGIEVTVDEWVAS